MEEKQQRIGLLTGAGSTIPFGMPGMAQFMNLLRSDPNISSHQLLDILTIIQANLQAPNRNNQDIIYDLEGVLAVIDIFLKFNNLACQPLTLKYLTETKIIDPSLSNKIGIRLDTLNKEFSILESDIKTMLFNIYGDTTKESNVFIPIIRHLKTVNCIFTTNYDLILENEIQQEFQLVDGFGQNAREEIKWNEDNFILQEDNFPYNNNCIHFFKLHGSVDWFYNKHKQEITKRNLPMYSGNPNTPNMIIYPVEKTYRRFYPFGILFDYFRKHLLKLDYLIIIGFSMRDEDINEIINQCMRDNESLRLIIWDPAAGQIKTKLVNSGGFQYFSPRIFPIDGSLSKETTANKATLDAIRTILEA